VRDLVKWAGCVWVDRRNADCESAQRDGFWWLRSWHTHSHAARGFLLQQLNCLLSVINRWCAVTVWSSAGVFSALSCDAQGQRWHSLTSSCRVLFSSFKVFCLEILSPALLSNKVSFQSLKIHKQKSIYTVSQKTCHPTFVHNIFNNGNIDRF